MHGQANANSGKAFKHFGVTKRSHQDAISAASSQTNPMGDDDLIKMLNTHVPYGRTKQLMMSANNRETQNRTTFGGFKDRVGFSEQPSEQAIAQF